MQRGAIQIYHRLFTENNSLLPIIALLQGSNNIALGYDEGSIMIKLGREEPAMSMDANGKIIWAKHSEIQQANLKALTGEVFHPCVLSINLMLFLFFIKVWATIVWAFMSL